MASGSLLNKRKHNKLRSKLKPPTPMASRPYPSSYYKKPSLILSLFLLLSVIVLLGISWNMRSQFIHLDSYPKIYTIEVVDEFPHDPDAFTQGLLCAGNGTIFESTGLHGKSSVRQVALRTGKVEVVQKMDVSYFGEGLTLLGERLFQVTWLKKTGFIYDRNNLSKFEKFTHQMKDGWGLATDGKVLFGSDGTSTLCLIDPHTLKLEFIDTEVWANVWQTDCIARISPKNGTVLGWILLQNLREKLVAAGNYGIDVLNGIAWDSEKKRVFVTGKLWPKLYEIKLHPAKKQFKSGVIKELCLLMPVHFAKP